MSDQCLMQATEAPQGGCDARLGHTAPYARQATARMSCCSVFVLFVLFVSFVLIFVLFVCYSCYSIELFYGSAIRASAKVRVAGSCSLEATLPRRRCWRVRAPAGCAANSHADARMPMIKYR